MYSQNVVRSKGKGNLVAGAKVGRGERKEREGREGREKRKVAVGRWGRIETRGEKKGNWKREMDPPPLLHALYLRWYIMPSHSTAMGSSLIRVRGDNNSMNDKLYPCKVLRYNCQKILKIQVRGYDTATLYFGMLHEAH